MSVTPSRIPQVIDNGAANDWLEYANEPWGFVRIGDVVDVYPVCPDIISGSKVSGRITSVKYGSSGELSGLFLESERKDAHWSKWKWFSCSIYVQWVDYPVAVYHHREDER